MMSLQQKLSEAYEKFTIDQEKQHHISNAADLIPSKFFKKSLDNQRDYDESIRKFALTFKVRINVLFPQFLKIYTPVIRKQDLANLKIIQKLTIALVKIKSIAILNAIFTWALTFKTEIIGEQP